MDTYIKHQIGLELFIKVNPPKNQFTGKLLTENMDLVNAIKEDAKTMSQMLKKI